jgi:malic enzyme
MQYMDDHTMTCSNCWSAQGTAAITLAALLSAVKVAGGVLAEQRVLFMGAGEAGAGIAELIAYCIHRESGVSRQVRHAVTKNLSKEWNSDISRRTEHTLAIALAHYSVQSFSLGERMGLAMQVNPALRLRGDSGRVV